MKSDESKLRAAIRRIIKEEKLSWNSSYEEFVSAIAGNADDPKVKAFLGAGLNDGADASDDKFAFKDGAISVSKLAPTQNEIDINGSLKWAIKDAKTFCNYVTSDGPFSPGGRIVTFNGHYVIDGHHRWSQVYCCNKNAKIEATDAQIEGLEPLEVLKAMQASIALEIGKVPTASVKGTNLLEVDQSVLDEYLDKNLSDQFVKGVAANQAAVSKMKESSGGATNEADEIAPPAPEGDQVGGAGGDVKALIKSYIWSNVEQMKKTSQPIPGAPKRDFMPQTDDAPGWRDPLAKGVVDIKAPHGGAKKHEARSDLGHPLLERWQRLSGILKG